MTGRGVGQDLRVGHRLQGGEAEQGRRPAQGGVGSSAKGAVAVAGRLQRRPPRAACRAPADRYLGFRWDARQGVGLQLGSIDRVRPAVLAPEPHDQPLTDCLHPPGTRAFMAGAARPGVIERSQPLAGAGRGGGRNPVALEQRPPRRGVQPVGAQGGRRGRQQREDQETRNQAIIPVSWCSTT